MFLNDDTVVIYCCVLWQIFLCVSVCLWALAPLLVVLLFSWRVPTSLWTAYSHVRTEPQSVIGHTRGKKNLQTAAKHQSTLWLLQASDSHAAKFGLGSTEKCWSLVPKQSVSRAPGTLPWDAALQREAGKADALQISCWWVDVNLLPSYVLVSLDGQRLTCQVAMWSSLSSRACGGRRQSE